MKILVTGAAGFIGGNLISLLEKSNIDFLGIDNFSPYYSAEMKMEHVAFHLKSKKIQVIDISNKGELEKTIKGFKPTHVIHLAAQGGVRASKNFPAPYIAINQMGFLNTLSISEDLGVEKFLYASSSSVYGEGLTPPFSESDRTYAPKSLYALSKLADELMAKHLPVKDTKRIGLRFFTVYGPWGRPDMAIFRILASSRFNEEFQLTANYELMRDFTYVSDVTKAILELLKLDFTSNKNEIFNIAGGNPYNFSQMFKFLEELGIKIKIKQFVQDELDVNVTHASVEKLKKTGICIPETNLKKGLELTYDWVQKIDLKKLRNWYEYTS
jgi:UDP-glucuronate 4-epimerase